MGIPTYLAGGGIVGTKDAGGWDQILCFHAKHSYPTPQWRLPDELPTFNRGPTKFQLHRTDGISWVARVRLPELGAFFGDRELLSVASTLRVEVASMKFLRYVRSVREFAERTHY